MSMPPWLRIKQINLWLPTFKLWAMNISTLMIAGKVKKEMQLVI